VKKDLLCNNSPKATRDERGGAKEQQTQVICPGVVTCRTGLTTQREDMVTGEE